MAKQYKIKINGGSDNKQILDLEQGIGDKGQPLKVKASPGVRYQLEDVATGFAPENIRAKRVGKDLRLSLEGSVEADLLIEDYYEVMPAGYNAVIGQAENGRFYEYIPESASGASSVQALGVNSVPVGMALGGSEVQASGAAVGVLMAAAGFNPLFAAPLALLAAGGGGGSGGQAPAPVSTLAHLTSTPLNDTGIKSDDNVTRTTLPEISGTATPGGIVSVEVNKKIYTTTAGADGQYKIKVTDALPDGLYIPKVTTAVGGQSTGPVDGTPFTVDTSSSNNADGSADPLASKKLAIISISQDTGVSNSDFVTADDAGMVRADQDGKLTLNGTSDAADGTLVVVKLDGIVLGTSMVKAGNWSFDYKPATGKTLVDGVYKLDAELQDLAGNVASSASSKNLVIDTSLNEGAFASASKLVIASVSQDTGVKPNDFITSDNAGTITADKDGKLTIGGTTDAGDGAYVGVKLDRVLIGYAPVKSGAWSFDYKPANGVVISDGSHTLDADLMDQAGNVKLSAPSQILVVDTSAASNYPNMPDPNTSAVVTIVSITDDSKGVSATDFITNDNTLVYKGKVAGGTLGSGWVQLELKDAQGKTVASNYVKPDVQSGEWIWDNTSAATPDGAYKLYATVVDDAGNRVNTSTSGQSLKDVVIDTLKPLAASITSLTDDVGGDLKLVTGAAIVQLQSYDLSSKPTNDNLPKFTITLPKALQSDETLNIVIDGQSQSVKPLVDAVDSKIWTWTQTDSAQVLSDSVSGTGGHVVTAFVADAAGNQSDVSNTFKVFVDTQPPKSPIIAFGVDTGFGTGVSNGGLIANRSDRVTQDAFFDIQDAEKTSGLITQYSLDAGKTWASLDVPHKLEITKDGVYADGQLQFRHVDAAGNYGMVDASQKGFRVDTVEPVMGDFKLTTDSGTHISADGMIQFNVSEAGWYSYTDGSRDTDGALKQTDWMYFDHTTSTVSLKLLPGTYSAGSLSVEFQDVAGNHVQSALSNPQDWTVKVSSASTLQLSPELILDLSSVSSSAETAVNSINESNSSSFSLKFSDVLSTSIDSSVQTASTVGSDVTLHDVFEASTTVSQPVMQSSQADWVSQMGSGVLLDMLEQQAHWASA